jgi:hypothetical protein
MWSSSMGSRLAVGNFVLFTVLFSQKTLTVPVAIDAELAFVVLKHVKSCRTHDVAPYEVVTKD